MTTRVSVVIPTYNYGRFITISDISTKQRFPSLIALTLIPTFTVLTQAQGR